MDGWSRYNGSVVSAGFINSQFASSDAGSNLTQVLGVKICLYIQQCMYLCMLEVALGQGERSMRTYFPKVCLQRRCLPVSFSPGLKLPWQTHATKSTFLKKTAPLSKSEWAPEKTYFWHSEVRF